MKRKKIPSLVKDQKLVERRRKQIIEAAVECYKEKGFHKTTTREIAEKAGFSIGTLYEYIRKKEDVLYLVCDAIYEEVQRKAAEAIGFHTDAVVQLKRALFGYFSVMDSMQDEVVVMYQEVKSLSKESLPYVLKKERDMEEVFEELLTRCVAEKRLSLLQKEIRCAANNLVIAGQMWAFRRWTLQEAYDINTYTELQWRLLYFGMKHVSEVTE
ncbi:TetR/AcrR family transcriptional regulator [Bacillus taeanensis]|uniref:TetR/AcrR family transcriptional regulator n=1 Tax=Bacillus taeanensis TaxID=273032 RepID=A0A366XRJ1_9BACI|nr:TetR/AcrR family transcriptional regulator [Bacillus taeanensis]RBW68752.1 TetR/AcrR family transcriptional regulator [Bacillus taeanensis]